jgi:hypothetical protein
MTVYRIIPEMEQNRVLYSSLSMRKTKYAPVWIGEHDRDLIRIHAEKKGITIKELIHRYALKLSPKVSKEQKYVANKLV